MHWSQVKGWEKALLPPKAFGKKVKTFIIFMSPFYLFFSVLLLSYVSNPSSWDSGSLPSILGIILFLFSCTLVVIITSYLEAKERERLLQLNNRVYAKIIGVEETVYYRKGRHKQYNFICEYEGQEYSSGALEGMAPFYLDQFLEEMGIEEIPMFIDPEDEDSFYIELESLIEYIRK